MSRIPKEEQNDYWNNYARGHLLNKVIVHVRYMTEDEANAIGWTTRPLALLMKDGSYIFPSRDDEGNNGGAFSGEFVENKLVGRKITSVGYMTEEEASNVGYFQRPLIMHLDDGGRIYPCRDEEGNDGGALFGSSAKGEELTFPVI